MKKIIKSIFEKIGYEIRKTVFIPGERMGIDPFNDISYFLRGNPTPLFFDVGGNEGQTVLQMLKKFPNATIHSFEPGSETFQTLQNNIRSFKAVRAWNLGIGAECKLQRFNENAFSSMSSFLPSTVETWGDIKKRSEVNVQTLDLFCRDNNICNIDLLKIDTQGYEYEVLLGAKRLLLEKNIKLIYLEVIFSGMYTNLPLFSSILSLLEQYKYSPVAFYDQHHKHPERILHWCDILFVHQQIKL